MVRRLARTPSPESRPPLGPASESERWDSARRCSKDEVGGVRVGPSPPPDARLVALLRDADDDDADDEDEDESAWFELP
eukprot:3138360-Rhodomonas_salina.1